MITSLIWGATLAIAGCAVSAFMIALIVRRPVAGLYLLSVPLVLLWEFPNSPLVASVAGTQIYLMDALSMFMLASCIITIFGATRHVSLKWVWVILALVFFAAVVYGISRFGPSTPIVEARLQLSFFAPVVWAAAVNWQHRQDGVLKWMYVTGTALIAVSAYHAATYGIGDANSFVESASGEQVGRVLVSGQALALVFFVWFSAVHGHGRRRGVFIFASVLCIIVSQQRTVWVVALVLICVGILVAPSRVKWMSVAATIGLVTSLLATAGAFSSLTFLAESADNNATYVARFYSWTQLVSQALDAGLQRILFGAPYGSGFMRLEMNGQIATFNPHNWYLTLFLRTGLLGLTIFVLAMVAMMLKQAQTAGLRWGLAGSAGILVYGWTYNLTFVAAILIGLMMSATSNVNPFAKIGDKNIREGKIIESA